MPKRGEIIHSATVSVTDLGYGSIDGIGKAQSRFGHVVSVTVARLFRSNEKVDRIQEFIFDYVLDLLNSLTR